MKFLYIMLSTVWGLYSWVCYDALLWKPPLMMPEHVREILANRSLQDIELGIQKTKMFLDSPNLTIFQKTDAHRELATAYWLKAFFQDSRKKQFAYLKLSVKELHTLMDTAPDWKQVHGWMADVLHIMGDYEAADGYYREARRYFPDNNFFRMRHREMRRKWRMQQEIDNQPLENRMNQNQNTENLFTDNPSG